MKEGKIIKFLKPNNRKNEHRVYKRFRAKVQFESR